jgi:glutamyl-tRNA reductase
MFSAPLHSQTRKVLDTFHSIAFTHRNLSVDEIGKLHISEEDQLSRLTHLKDATQLVELQYLSTCNRVELFFCTTQPFDYQFILGFFRNLYPAMELEEIGHFAHAAEMYSGLNAVEHVLKVASSIDSMIIGEREIITQVRNAFDSSKKMGLTGDFLRILMRHTIETAKKVYTQTAIAKKPVSVVSLAYHKLRELNIPLSARFLIVGAGTTNTNMSRFLRKHGFKNFVVFNRTFSKAEKLAKDLKGRAFPLSHLRTYKEGFDVIIACTGTDTHLISEDIYRSLLINEGDKKVVIDIAIPQDLHPNILKNHAVTHISVNLLQQISNANLETRSAEVENVEKLIVEALLDFKQIQRLRQVEIAMREVPQRVKQIKSIAINHVFKNKLDGLDPGSKELLEEVIEYMEKKFMNEPMLMAKQILLNN